MFFWLGEQGESAFPILALLRDAHKRIEYFFLANGLQYTVSEVEMGKGIGNARGDGSPGWMVIVQ